MAFHDCPLRRRLAATLLAQEPSTVRGEAVHFAGSTSVDGTPVRVLLSRALSSGHDVGGRVLALLRPFLSQRLSASMRDVPLSDESPAQLA
jgi:hypothetical protein